MEILKTKIIIFEDGTYFNGVKGHCIRKTVHFKDAKTMNEISNRDARYLAGKIFKLATVKYSMEVISTE